MAVKNSVQAILDVWCFCDCHSGHCDRREKSADGSFCAARIESNATFPRATRPSIENKRSVCTCYAFYSGLPYTRVLLWDQMKIMQFQITTFLMFSRTVVSGWGLDGPIYPPTPCGPSWCCLSLISYHSCHSFLLLPVSLAS